ncbi:MAG TPA: ABC transporter ATP-binding protein [Ignavibacteriales bacterium]|nr:ABC transporter ATP-binding protein [Ignavibacteriales bacterium]HOL80296.1 ABC transporter ATP-binding protein [Ignavibacteriales bacterium]HOM64575.1 ABC transporter ATP-binding protein [Ignavibacteriales bacterium]HPD66672.1 ABC transporter ATP-binding protein [Ignavibacteriales bacterium]HPP32485.1 ABC transporter ATP-binding protein [Ignavibacteriales bacterium]
MKELLPLKKYLLRYKKKIILGFICIIFSNFFATIIPQIIQKTIDIFNNSNNLIHQKPILIEYTILIILFSAISGVFRYYIRQTIIVASRLIENDLRNDLFTHIIKLPYSFFYNNSTGNLMALSTNDINAVRNFLGPAIMYSTDNIIKFLFIFIMMLNIDIQLTIYALLPLPFISILVVIIGRKVQNYYSQVLKQFGVLTTIAQENISLVRVVKSYSIQENFIKKFDKNSKEYYHINIRMMRIMSLVQPLLIFLVGLSLTITLLIGGYDVITGRLTIGEITALTIYLGLLIWPMFAFGWVTNMIHQANASMKRLNEVFNLPIEIDDNSQVNLKEINEIEFKNVSFEVDNKKILDNITFKIQKHQKVAIIGKTGAGKTTIFNLITKILSPTSGEIHINGININSIPAKDIRANLAYITQEAFLFSDTIKNNILFCCQNSDKNLNEIITLSALDKDISSFPNGIDTIIGEKGITLSGGQKQRVAIARALASNYNFFLFDDSFSAIDTDTENRIISNLYNFLENKTALFISHRVSTIKNCDYIYVLDKGKIIEQGTNEYLLNKNGYYAKLYNHQMIEIELDNA